MKILYGSSLAGARYINITAIVIARHTINSTIIIPKGDHARADLFGDPCPNYLKDIIITINDETTVYSHQEDICVNISEIKTIKQIINSDEIYNSLKINNSLDSTTNKLQIIHDYVHLDYGDMGSEYPEQVMAMTYIGPNCKVLEIGSNIGTNSIIISTILSDDRNLVTLECDQQHIGKLNHHKVFNGYSFNIEPSALSSVPLAQRGWHTFPIENGIVPPDSTLVNTISYNELKNKYNIVFDTLVADCEGALYFILKDTPYILYDIRLLIVENDYILLEHKQFVDNLLLQYGFTRIYGISGGWSNAPCYECFYEVWYKH